MPHAKLWENLPGNFVAQRFRRNDGHLFADTLVCMEIHIQTSVILLNDDLGGLLDGLCTYATLISFKKKENTHTQQLVPFSNQHPLRANKTFIFSSVVWGKTSKSPPPKHTQTNKTDACDVPSYLCILAKVPCDGQRNNKYRIGRASLWPNIVCVAGLKPTIDDHK